MSNRNVPGLSAAISANREGMGLSNSPSLPPGLAMGSGMPRPSLTPNGAPEGTSGSLAGSILGAIMNRGGMVPPKGVGSRGARPVEKPSIARSNAISRRLNGGASRGKELKGL